MSKIDYTLEKISLARELGLENCAIAMEQVQKEIEAITTLKFNKITVKEIGSMIEKRIFKPFYHTTWGVSSIYTLLIGGTISLLYSLINYAVDNAIKSATIYSFINPFLVIGISTLLISLTCFIFSSFPKCECAIMSLKNWNEPMPRGALLSIKEAVDAGLTDFMISYPKLEDKRVFSDPVITAKKPGLTNTIFLVHAWDDRKVYD